MAVDQSESTATSKYHILRSVVFGVLVAVVSWELVLSPGLSWWNTKQAQSEAVEAPQKHQSSEEMVADSVPVKLSIPKINLTAEFTRPLGINQTTGEIEVPEDYDKVGWYKYSPGPGQAGPMIILGHVDNYEGPAVFYSIGQLKEGDEIEVVNDEGVRRVYEVERSVKYEQADFPTELVYGNTEGPELRLITCSGIFDDESQRYSHNRVVYAKLKTNN